MIRDVAYWTEWERQGPLSERLDLERNWALFDSMYEYARQLGKWDRSDPLEGIETVIEMARVLNAPCPPGKSGPGPG